MGPEFWRNIKPTITYHVHHEAERKIRGFFSSFTNYSATLKSRKHLPTMQTCIVFRRPVAFGAVVRSFTNVFGRFLPKRNLEALT